MEKEFVTYELALRMKALGFDEPCFGYFCNDRRDCKLEFIPIKLAKNWNGIESNLDESPIYNGRNKKEVKESLDERNLLFLWTSAPTWQSAFDWFGEKYKLYASVVVDQTSYPKYAYEISKFVGNPKDLTEDEWEWDDMIFSPSLYRTTIEAKMYCLTELINIAEKI